MICQGMTDRLWNLNCLFWLYNFCGDFNGDHSIDFALAYNKGYLSYLVDTSLWVSFYYNSIHRIISLSFDAS